MRFVFNTVLLDDELHVTEIGHSQTVANKKYGPWTRKTYIIHFIVGGQGYYNGLHLHAGDAYLITPKALERIETTDDPAEHYWIAFYGKRAEALLEKCGISLTPQALSFQKTQQIRMIFEKAINTELSELNLSFYYTSVFYKLLSLYNDTKSLVTSSIVSRAKMFISANLSRKITVEDIAKYCAVSPKHLCRLFKNDEGVSPLSYILTEKFETAKDILLSTDMPIKEVAASVGFDDSCYFSTAFKAYENCSPKQYRLMHKR